MHRRTLLLFPKSQTVAVLGILGTGLIGLYSQTIKFSWVFDVYDLTLTTPCTIMLYYSVILAIVASSGCFAGSGGRWWSTGLVQTYCCAHALLSLLVGFIHFIFLYFPAVLPTPHRTGSVRLCLGNSSILQDDQSNGFPGEHGSLNVPVQ